MKKDQTKMTTTTEPTTLGSTKISNKTNNLIGDVSLYYDWALERCSYEALTRGFLVGFGLCFFVPLFNYGLRFILEAFGVWQWAVELSLPFVAALIGFIVAKLTLRWRRKNVQRYKCSNRKEK